jgi:hypothetical protein
MSLNLMRICPNIINLSDNMIYLGLIIKITINKMKKIKWKINLRVEKIHY